MDNNKSNADSCMNFFMCKLCTCDFHGRRANLFNGYAEFYMNKKNIREREEEEEAIHFQNQN